MGEEFVFIIIFEQTISDTIKELTTNEYNLQYKILRMNRLKMVIQ